MSDDKKHALLMVGSPRLEKSTSYSLGSYLLSQLHSRGIEISLLMLSELLCLPEYTKRLFSAIDGVSILIISSPLYMFAPPADVIKVMEILKNMRGKEEDEIPTDRKYLLAISNCGLPTVESNDLSLDIYRKFADETGFYWWGGLALAMGEALSEKKLEDVPAITRNVIKSLNLVADALSAGNPLPERAISLMRRPILPFSLYESFRPHSIKMNSK